VAHDNRPCKVDYRIGCDAGWTTRSVSLHGNVGERLVEIEITRNANATWHSNGMHVPAVDGCIDVDLGFSPSTNLLPIRRLQLGIGDRADVRAAWVRFPEFSLELLQQSYTRLNENHYLYESAGGAFTRELLTNAEGFVLEYPDYWRAQAQMPCFLGVPNCD
jgi:hypothetical protein